MNANKNSVFLLTGNSRDDNTQCTQSVSGVVKR